MRIQEDKSGSDPESSSNESDLTVDNELLYHGRRYDTESNLYYYRARYFDPILGRFLSTDPMGYKDSMNLYQAFNMNGMNFVDPFGEAVIVLDPGHGSRYYLVDSKTGKFKRDKKGNKIPGNDSGANRHWISEDLKYEKDQALKLASILKEKLKAKGHSVFLTRDKDLFEKVRKRFAFRTEFAKGKKADLFISLHVDSFLPKTSNRFMVGYFTKKGKKLANSIANSVNVESFIFQIDIGPISFNLQKGFSSKRIESHAYRVLTLLEQDIPNSVLVESGNIQNPLNTSLIFSDQYTNQLVEGIHKFAYEIDKEKYDLMKKYFINPVLEISRWLK